MNVVAKQYIRCQQMKFCSIISAATVVRGRDYSTGVLCNIWFPPETHPELKSCKIFYAHDLLCSHSFVLKFCTEHGGIPAVLSAKYQNDCISETDVMDERVFSRFKFKMSFERISYIAQHHRSLWSAIRVDVLRWCGSANHQLKYQVHPRWWCFLIIVNL